MYFTIVANSSRKGDTLVIGSSLCTALYMVFYAKYMKGFELKNIFLFLGCVGVTNVILLWPGLVMMMLLPLTYNTIVDH